MASRYTAPSFVFRCPDFVFRWPGVSRRRARIALLRHAKQRPIIPRWRHCITVPSGIARMQLSCRVRV
eukprot:3087802-Rhodomonas_salina.1